MTLSDSVRSPILTRLTEKWQKLFLVFAYEQNTIFIQIEGF